MLVCLLSESDDDIYHGETSKGKERIHIWSTSLQCIIYKMGLWMCTLWVIGKDAYR